MDEWKYTFDPVSKNEWIKQIEKDLKQASVESLQREWWPGESVFPLHHKEDIKEIVSLPDDFFINPPLIIEWVKTVQDTDEMRKKLMQALKYGAQSIIFEFDYNNKPDLDYLLKDVLTEMLELSVQINPENFSRNTFIHDAL